MRKKRVICHLLLTTVISGGISGGLLLSTPGVHAGIGSEAGARNTDPFLQSHRSALRADTPNLPIFVAQLAAQANSSQTRPIASQPDDFETIPLTQTQDADAYVADTLENEETVLFEADNIYRESENSPIIAEGNVRAFFGERYLTAGKLIFDPATDIVTAENGVSITDANQETVFADRVELSGDLRDGLVQNFTALLAENARVAADSAIREQGARTTLNKVVYTACDVCKDNGDGKTPTWRIKSIRVTRDEERKVIRFRHAFLELKGVPVFYTPFLQAPDPSVERQSGFLTPTIGTSSRLSPFVEIPYYFAFSNNLDFTFFPKFTVDDGTLWQGEFRRAGNNSFHVWAGGVTNFDQEGFQEELLADEFPGNDNSEIPDGVRWYYFGRGYHNVTNRFRIGYDIERTSDDTFLRIYDVFRRGDLRLEFDRSRTNRLRSNFNTAWSNGNTTLTTDSYLFQGLRTTDDSSITPFVLPLLNLRHDFRYKPGGGNLSINANFASLQRTSGTDSRRFTAQAFWDREYITRSGHRFNAFAELRGDAFFFQDLDEGTELVPDGFVTPGERTTDIVGRFAPTAGLEWSFPVARQLGDARLLLEPRVQLIASLNNRNPNSILNEDSQSIEFDFSGLFDYNKSTGFDAVEDGQRINAGVLGSIAWTNGIKLEAAIGQQFRLQNTDAFLFTVGLGETRSDIVGELNLDIQRKISLRNRFRFDDSGNFNRLESTLGFNVWRLQGQLNYTLLEDEVTTIGLSTEEEINALARFNLSRNWSIGAAWREDLRPDPAVLRDDFGFIIRDPITDDPIEVPGEGTIRQDFLLGYRDECSSFEVILRRDRTRDIGVGPNTSVLVRFTLNSLASSGFASRRR